jgi:transposase
MRGVIGMDIHRSFGEVVIWENGVLRHAGQVDTTWSALEGLGSGLAATDEVVIEATGNSMAVSRVLSRFVARVIIANPLQVKAIAHAHVKTDKIDAGTLASLRAAGYLPEIWTPDAAAERKCRLVARRYQVVRHRTRFKNEVHSILHAHLIPKCPHADLFGARGRTWLALQALPDDECSAIDRHMRELDRLAVNLTVAAGIMAAIGDITRFKSPGKLVSYFGLNPRVASRDWVPSITDVSARSAVARPVRCWSKRLGRQPGRLARFMRSSSAFAPGEAIKSPPLLSRGSSPSNAGIC